MENLLGKCPFCISEYPDGQEFSVYHSERRLNDEPGDWEFRLICCNCGTTFLVDGSAQDSEDRQAEDRTGLCKNLQIEDVR